MKKYIWGFFIFLIVSIIIGISLLHVTNAPEVEKRKDGSIRSIILKEPTYFDTSCGKIKTKDAVFYHKNGKIHRLFLSKPQLIDTPLGKLKVKMTVSFYKNGNLRCAAPSDPQLINTPLGKLKVQLIDFYKSGKIKHLVLANLETIEVKSIKLDTQKITFFESGQIHLISLKGTAIINGYRYKDKSLIELDKTGKIIKISQGGDFFGDVEPPVPVVEEHRVPNGKN